jgi:hypothetical protein
MTRNDQIGKEYYTPLQSAEQWSDLAFFCAAALSIAALLVDRVAEPKIYEAVQSLFALSVIIVFAFGISTRLYWSARAQEMRCADFISKAFNVPLIYETTTGYYNTNQKDPFKRIGAYLLENTLFSKHIARKMLTLERVKVALYASLWFLAVFNRAADLALIAAAAQVLFSEQIISRWLRLEWLRNKFESVYDASYNLLQATTDFQSKQYIAHVIQLFVVYETGKAQAGVSLSSRIFRKVNPVLSAEWQEISKRLSLSEE